MTIGLLSIVGEAHEPCHLDKLDDHGCWACRNNLLPRHLDKLGVLIFNFSFQIASLRSASRFARVLIASLRSASRHRLLRILLS